MKLNEWIREAIGLLFWSLLFCVPAFINGFPLVTSDTGTYLSSGYGPVVPFDRPVLYGLFVHLTGMKESLWYVLIIQGLLVAWILSQAVLQFLPKYSSRLYRTVIFVILAYTTSLPWFCSQIMTDLFSALPAICIALLLAAPNQTWFQKFMTAIILLFSCLTHNSHLIVNTLLIVFLFILAVTNKYFYRKTLDSLRFIKVTILVFSCWPLSFLINYFVDSDFRMAGSPHVFLTARFAESGILQDYLKSNCTYDSEEEISDSSTYFIMAKHSKKFMDVEGSLMDDNAYLHQWSYVNGLNQKFHLIKTPESHYKIVVVHSGKTVSVKLDSSLTQQRLVQATDSGTDGQRFRLLKAGVNSYMIENVLTGKVVDVADFSTDNGAWVQLIEKNGSDNQQFQFISQTSNKLCFVKDNIPRTAVDFIWAENSVFMQTGGWESTEEDYSIVVHDIIFGTEYFLWNLRESLVSTVRQLVKCEVGDGLYPYGINSSPTLNIKKYFRKDVNAFLTSQQNQFGIDFSNTNKRILLIMSICSVILLIFILNKKNVTYKKELWIMSVICVFSMILNAFVNGTMANVLNRLQSRIIWIIPFCVLLIVFPAIIQILKRIFAEKNEN